MTHGRSGNNPARGIRRAEQPARWGQRNGHQQLTRIPPIRPGAWVKVRPDAGGGPDSLAGRVLRVRSLTCSITEEHQPRARWRIHFENGRSVQWEQVLRIAAPAEIEAARRQKGDQR